MRIQRSSYQWSEFDSPPYKSYTLSNFREIPQIRNLSKQLQFEMEVVANIFPFKANNYVVEQLIDWKKVPNDPMFILTFPQKGMLQPRHFNKMASALRKGIDKKEIQKIANKIRLHLNPHPAGQMEQNCTECSTSIKRQFSSFQAKVKHVMHIAASVLDGRSLLE